MSKSTTSTSNSSSSTSTEKPSRSYRLHEFDPTSYDWLEWEILFDTYIDVEGITDDTKKRNLLITVLGVQAFKTLISVCKPRKPTEYTFQEIILKLRTNYARVTFSSTERIKFFATRQESSQSLNEFANGLRDKTATCRFPADFYEEALITAFVGGLQNDHVRKHLMQQNLETFEHTLNTARTIESILIQGSLVKGGASEDFSIMKIQKHHKQPVNQHHQSICLSCGSRDHPRLQCRFRNVTCYKCHKEGHISKVCRSNTSSNKNHVNTVFVSSLEQTKLEHPIQIPIRIDGVKVYLDLDTGSPITIINEHVWIKMGQPKLQLVKSIFNSFSGHSIHFKGEKRVNVEYNDQIFQLKLYVVNGGGNNVMGRDWINALNLNSRTLNDIISNMAIQTVNHDFKNLNELFIHYNDLFKDGLGCCKIKAHLYVKPNVIPKFCKARSLPFAYRQAVENDLDRLVNEGVLEPINVSKWAAPIVVVPKPGGKVRICADLSTGVNQALDIEQYPLPKPNDLFVTLNGGTVFSKIDFSEAYLQVQLDDESKELMVINTHKGLFRFNRLPFGVASAPSIFQKIMDQMLAGLDGVVSYLDDVIIMGKNKIDHLNNLHKVLERIKEYGFHINKSKCTFSQDNVEYLGFVVDKHGVHTSPSKTKAIIDMPKPSNLSQLRSFLGMVNHYGENAFTNIKQLLISPLVLTHYDPSLPLVLAADASNSGVGAVLYHRYPDGKEKAIAHASKTLTQTESRYAQIEKEALAIIYGIQKFDQFLRGRRFTLLTDHKPLITIFGPKKGIPTTSANRLQRWALRLMGYSYNIEYCSTNNFGQADGLSRLPVGPDSTFDKQDPGDIHIVNSIQQELQSNLPIRAAQVAKETQKDPILIQVYKYMMSGWPLTIPEQLQSYYRIRNELSTSFGCLTWGLRTIIPSCYRINLLNHLHGTHSGMGRMKAEARCYFWWPLLDQDIENLVKGCSICSQHSKQPVKAPLQQWKVPEQPWQRIHIDFMGRFMNNYFLVVVDAHSKWLEVFIMNTITSSSTINVLQTLFARYGLPDQIVSDNGTQFCSEEFADYCAQNGIQHIRTTPHHPQSNGQAERYVDTVKSALTKGLHNGGKVSDVLLKFLFCYRTTPHSTTNLSPAELFLKRQPRTVLDLLRPNSTSNAALNKARLRYKKNFDHHSKRRIFQEGENVIVRDFRGDPNKIKWSPGVILNPQGSRIWLVQMEDQVWRRHENQIKHRDWSTDQDILIPVETTTNSTSTSTTDRESSSSSSSTPTSPSDTTAPLLRRSSRVKRPVHRLIEEI